MSEYTFQDIIINKIPAFDAYLRNNLSWVTNYNGCTGGPPLIIYTLTVLSDQEYQELQTLVNNYTDPSVFLEFDHSEAFTMHSHFTDDQDNTVINEDIVLQTFIFPNQNQNNSVLDCFKTVGEYRCENPSLITTTSGNLTLSIYDISRNVQITSQTVDISNVLSTWNTSNITVPNTIFKTIQFYGLSTQVPNYDTVWQIRVNSNQFTNFNFRINGMQYLFYNEI